jgi:aspartate/methionine/tyrosine aminotransferase
MEEAEKLGFYYGNPEWVNLGQGAPEVNALEGAPLRITNLEIPEINQNYPPVAGLKEVREKVATLYNQLFRENLASKYTFKNVNIGGGGRLCLSRVIGTMATNINLGYITPDYASYEGILSAFNNVTPVQVELTAENNFYINFDKLIVELQEKEINALLLSNPSNPTGTVIKGADLKKLIAIARKLNVYLILDEFYFNYIYENGQRFSSAAEFIEDVNKDPIIIVSGITKAWRYPGWRIGWVVGPENIITSVSATGSFLDGGTSNPLQHAALQFLSVDNLRQETAAIYKVFKAKRDYMLAKLTKMGIVVENNPVGGFYVWGNLNYLPTKFRTGMNFFREALMHKVIVVPGEFFDLNPYGKRKARKFLNYVRFSYSVSMEKLQKGLEALEKMIAI